LNILKHRQNSLENLSIYCTVSDKSSAHKHKIEFRIMWHLFILWHSTIIWKKPTLFVN